MFKLDFFYIFVTKQGLRDAAYFLKCYILTTFFGCPFEYWSYAGFAEAANAGFKSFKSISRHNFGIESITAFNV